MNSPPNEDVLVYLWPVQWLIEYQTRLSSHQQIESKVHKYGTLDEWTTSWKRWLSHDLFNGGGGGVEATKNSCVKDQYGSDWRENSTIDFRINWQEFLLIPLNSGPGRGHLINQWSNNKSIADHSKSVSLNYISSGRRSIKIQTTFSPQRSSWLTLPCPQALSPLDNNPTFVWRKQTDTEQFNSFSGRWILNRRVV